MSHFALPTILNGKHIEFLTSNEQVRVMAEILEVFLGSRAETKKEPPLTTSSTCAIILLEPPFIIVSPTVVSTY